MNSARKRPVAGVLLAIALVFILTVSSAAPVFAAGTGDDPTPTEDVLTPAEAARKARLESKTPQDGGTGEIGVMVVDAPYKYLYTPSHLQEKNYWCGPATVQVIHDYFGTPQSQQTYANWLGTGTGGTDFSKVDDCLRAYTGRSYYYYGSLTQTGFNTRVSDSLLNHGYPLAADVNIYASVWPNYNYDHNGHIIPIEAFDWRYMTIRINDVYSEAYYRSGGGNTYGHKTYSQAVVWHGVYNHFRRAVVSAP